MPNCYYCNAVVDGSIRGNYGDAVCERCFEQRFCFCMCCHAVIHRDDSYPYSVVNTDDQRYCYACYHRLSMWNTGNEIHSLEYNRVGSPLCFGIELETASCPKHTELRGKTQFGVKEDGSINGLEFISPILSGNAGLNEIRSFCRLAKKQGFTVDADCGFHLHIDMRQMSWSQRRSIAYAYRLTYTLWKHLVSDSRWNNTYCESPSYSSRQIASASSFTAFERNRSRYEFLNLRAYSSHKTYEIRGYQGTLNATEICNWVKVNLRFVEAVKDKPLNELCEMFAPRKAKRELRRIFGTTLSNYYARAWRKHSHLIGANG